MAVNFKNAGSLKTIENTKKVEQEKAQVVALQYIRNENLIDNPKNGEDISQTADLEESMKQNGFTDPMEVTDFNMPDGKYMILSGHRRRAAGVKVFGGEYAFPCIVRHFNTAEEVQNYTLMANAQRDSAKDPCLFCARYKMHEQYLESIGFKGSKREEIAKRLGISVQQADRYNKMNDVILPVWDMVRAEIVAMSSVVALASRSESEQFEILGIMQEALAKDVTLTRDTMKSIVDGHKVGKKTWAAVAGIPRDSGLPLNSIFNTDSGETKEPKTNDRRDEGYVGYDPIAAEYDAIDEEKKQWEQEQAEAAEQSQDVETETEEKGGAEKHKLTPEEKKLKLGADIAQQLHKLDSSLQNVWKCEDSEKAKEMVINMESVVQALIDEMHRVSEDWDMADEFKSSMGAIESALAQYK